MNFTVVDVAFDSPFFPFFSFSFRLPLLRRSYFSERTAKKFKMHKMFVQLNQQNVCDRSAREVVKNNQNRKKYKCITVLVTYFAKLPNLF